MTSPEEAAMLWVLGSAILLVGLWLGAPTMRTFVHRNFDPVRRSDASVFQAQQSSHP